VPVNGNMFGFVGFKNLLEEGVYCSSFSSFIFVISFVFESSRGRRGGDRMVVGFTTTCATSAYHHSSCEFESCSWRGVHDTTLCNKVYQ